MATERITETTGSIHEAIDNRKLAVTILRAGTSQNGYTYPEQVLEAAAALFEGVPSFCDHQIATRRSVRDLVGSHHQAAYTDGAIKSVMHLLDPTIATLIRHILEDRAAAIQTPDVGLSVDMAADFGPNKIVHRILAVNSVDVVFHPSAGGSFDRVLEQALQEANTMSENTNTTNTAASASAASAQGGGQNATAAQVVQEAATLQDTQAQIEALRQTRLAACGDLLTLRLSASALPEPARHRIAERFAGRIYETTELETAITDMRTLVGALTGPQTIQANGVQRIQAGFTLRDRLTAAADFLMGNQISDAARASIPRDIGLRDLFKGAGFDGQLGWETRRVMESNEVTTSVMANIVGTSINKRLVHDFQGQPKWWKPIVVEVPLKDMKLQTRVKLNDFAVLPTVAEEGAYLNLAWDDVGETYTPLKKGSAVTVTLETIINDDLRAVQQIPKKLARAATMTINAVIVALFTANSGAGSALVDTYYIFDATHHQSNLGSAALDQAALTAGMLAIAKMTDTASHRLGLQGQWLLIPPDLEFTAFTLLYSQLQPGTTDNDINAMRGRAQHIVVPGFTDTNNWYLLADPAQAELIEIGYLNGQQTPELMVQDDPTAGTVFTNDYITYKIRWIFGAGWLDYRGAYGAVVT